MHICRTFGIWIFLMGVGYYTQAQQITSQQFDQEVRDAIALIFSDPGSGKLKLDALKKHRTQLPDSLIGHLYGAYGIYYGVTGNPDPGISYLKNAVRYFHQIPEMQGRTLRNLGNLYRIKGDFKASIDYYHQALVIFKKEEKQFDQATTYGEIGSSYSMIQNYTAATDYFLKGIHQMEQLPDSDTRNLMVMKQKLGNAYMATKNYAFAKKIMSDVLQSLEETEDKVNYYTTLITYSEALIALNEYKAAQKGLLRAIEGLKPFNNGHINSAAYAALGSIAYHQKNKYKALEYATTAHRLALEANSSNVIPIANTTLFLLCAYKEYNQAYKLIRDKRLTAQLGAAGSESKMTFHQYAAEVYLATKQFDQATLAMQASNLYRDSLFVEGKRTVTEDMQAKYQNQVQRQENELLAQRIKIQKRTLAIGFAGSLCLLVIGLYSWNVSRLKSELKTKDLEIISAQKAQLEQKLRIEEELNQMKEQVIHAQQRELIATTLESANFHAQIKHLLDKLKAKEKINVHLELSKLANEQEYWKIFMDKFNLLNPSFINNLQALYPDLTNSEAHFCALVKLNLSYKEIAAILQINHKSVFIKKFRINQKIKLKDESTFEDVIRNIS